MIEKHNMFDKVLVASFSNRDLEQFRARCPRVATSASPHELLKFQLGNDPFTSPTSRPDCLQIKDRIKAIRIITRDSVTRARRLNLPIHAWTVNDRPTMERLLDLGIDGIMTDETVALREVLGARHQWHPRCPDLD